MPQDVSGLIKNPSGANGCKFGKGDIAALNDRVILEASGSSSATITVRGTFTGIIEVVGRNELDTIETDGSVTEQARGSRLVFKSGVGSLGENLIRGLGTAINSEFRVVTGARYIELKAASWDSGSAEISIFATPDPSINFINGPVHGSEEEAVRAGRAFSAGTGTQAALAGDYIKATFTNPSDSGVNAFVTLRQFTNNRTGNTLPELQFFVSPTALTGTPTPVQQTPNNLKTGGVSSVIEFTYQVNTTSLGTPNLQQVLPINGVSRDIRVLRLVQPGESFGYQIVGSGGGLANALRAAMSFIWYEETVN